ncbi:MAG: beta-carotene 15,15'-dioxygenase, Brp/Blh family [Actinobacteria bacterium]|nr:beta-carotene 15,15'-dioxygenase, Brp/Blh family [Actinomycetota bacterium]
MSDKNDLSWQVGIAVFALAVGIPHGALDHLVTVPRTNKRVMALFICGYVAVAVGAVLAILKWNVFGFQLVVLMSLVHFGIGDSAFLNELDRLKGLTTSRLPTAFVFLAFGAVPVVIPLINSSSTSALAEVNSSLINWHQGFDNELGLIVQALLLIAVLALVATKRFRDVIDLCLLAGLAIFTPPLIAFATYFGCWHAMRHTARLSLVLPQSQRDYEAQHAVKAFFSAVIPGTPALIGSFVVAAGLWLSGSIEKSFFWFLLTIVWALTVPHMIVTAKLDRSALQK